MSAADQTWILRKARRDEATVGFFGGHPRGVRASDWPRCRVCGTAMCHMGQFRAGPALPLGSFEAMSLFICHATGGRCEDWDPWKGANKVVLHPRLDDVLYDGPPTVRVYRRVPLAAEGPRAEGGRSEVSRGDKIGGTPAWLQGPATPPSPSGKGPMRLALQITTEIVRFDITESGVAYVFVDPWLPATPEGRMLWQWAGQNG